MSGGFQTAVSVQPAPAIAGDFASTNPRQSVLAGPGGIVAGALGLTVGRFAWLQAGPLDPNSAPTIANNFGAGLPAGLVHREQQGLITTYLANAGMLIPQGFGVTLFKVGDFWVKNDGSTQTLIGQKAFANLANGQISFAAAGATVGSAATVTGAVTAATFSVTGSITNNILTVTAVGSGTVVAGGTISGTGIASGTKVVSQISGTAGGIGAYYVDIAEQTVASTTVSGTYGLLTVTAVTSGNLYVGGIVAGGTIAANTTLTQILTGSGGIGTYVLNTNTTSSSGTVTETSNIETAWIAMSSGIAGELIKVSRWSND